MDWNPHFCARSPMLAPLAAVAAPLAGCSEWPRLEKLQELVTASGVSNACGIALRLVPPGAGPFEERVYVRGELAVHEKSWHDLLNVLVWLVYPRAKAALNARHYDAQLGERARSQQNRGRARDALTLFDENGVVVASTECSLLESLRALRWKHVFWERRACMKQKAQVVLFGHALFAKALRPYVGMSGHALLVDVPPHFASEPLALREARLDALIASRISDQQAFATPHALTPLPVLGVPGWWHSNEEEAFYDDTHYFRPARAGRAQRR
jgi:hypothetical protein